MTQSCGNSTVEDFDPTMAEGAKAFLSHLKAAMQSGNKQEVASMAAYPISIFENSKKTTLHTAGEFISKYSHLITPAVKKAVDTQSADCLFANYQGAMIGNGTIWFRRQRNQSFKIVTINLGGVETK